MKKYEVVYKNNSLPLNLFFIFLHFFFSSLFSFSHFPSNFLEVSRELPNIALKKKKTPKKFPELPNMYQFFSIVVMLWNMIQIPGG